MDRAIPIFAPHMIHRGRKDRLGVGIDVQLIAHDIRWPVAFTAALQFGIDGGAHFRHKVAGRLAEQRIQFLVRDLTAFDFRAIDIAAAHAAHLSIDQPEWIIRTARRAGPRR